MERHASLVLLLASAFSVQAQTIISGRVIDAATSQPLEFASIGIPGDSAFTLSSTNGSFALAISATPATDSVTFALVGYIQQRIALSAWAHGPVDVHLMARIAELPTLEVAAGKLEERRIGIRSHHPFFNYLVETTRPEEVLEIAQAIDLGTAPLRIKAVNVFISWASTDTGIFRVNFRSINGDTPGEALVQRSLLRKVSLATGWATLDLSVEHIVLRGPIVVTLELLPVHREKKIAISCGIRLGGGAKGFDRRGTFSTWSRPPHRYSINVTALVPTGAPPEPYEDPDPFQALVDTVLYAPSVRDSFAIAVEVPDQFDPYRPGGYPVIFLLDANVFFSDVTEACRRSARERNMPPVLIVGVGYRDVVTMDSLRDRDYFFPVALEQDSLANSGGGLRFLTFFSDVLVPYIDRYYPVDTTARVLAGHSAGGYFTLLALHRSLQGGHGPFSRYVAASPSLYYADTYLLQELTLDGPSTDTDPHVFLSVGGREDEDKDEHIRPPDERSEAMLNRMAKILRQRLGAGAVHTRTYPHADHMDTALPSFADGIRWSLSPR